MDFLAANHVRIVGLCGHVHRVVIFAIAQLSCWNRCFSQPMLYTPRPADRRAVAVNVDRWRSLVNHTDRSLLCTAWNNGSCGIICGSCDLYSILCAKCVLFVLWLSATSLLLLKPQIGDCRHSGYVANWLCLVAFEQLFRNLEYSLYGCNFLHRHVSRPLSCYK